MGHFTIKLPEHKRADVRWGMVSKKSLLPFFRKKISETKRGYIVQVAPPGQRIEYRLFKTHAGEWSKDPDGNAPLDNETLFFIRDAIIEKEKTDR